MENELRWDGSDQDFWDAVAIANDPDADETDAIRAAVILQEVLTLAQDTLTRPEGIAAAEPDKAPSIAPPKVGQRPRPGDIVTTERAVELFADRWILRPLEPSKESALSALRDYRMEAGELQYNTSYPPAWQSSASTIDGCPQWLVVCQQTAAPSLPVAQNGRQSRTTVRTGT